MTDSCSSILLLTEIDKYAHYCCQKEYNIGMVKIHRCNVQKMKDLMLFHKVMILVRPAGTSRVMNLVLNKPKTSPLLMMVSHAV
jgi:hypothetical protein